MAHTTFCGEGNRGGVSLVDAVAVCEVGIWFAG